MKIFTGAGIGQQALANTLWIYRAMSSIVCEIEWLTYILDVLKVQSIKPTLPYYDNQAARHIASTKEPKH